MRCSPALWKLLQSAAIVSVAAGVLLTLWWSEREEPASITRPAGWTFGLDAVDAYLVRAEAALLAGNEAEAADWIDRARDQSAAIRRDIQADHAAWMEQCY